MTKTNTPLLSFGATGTLGDSATFARRRGVDLIEKKPIPVNPQTLPQMYQRWLYEDYVYRWTQQTAATKRLYAASGVRYHLTGFQYWMKYMLTHLPDIVAWWKCDDNTGATTSDSSRNNLTCAIVGASPGYLAIDKAFIFDGLNDYLVPPNTPLLNLIDDFSIELFFNHSYLPAALHTIFDRSTFPGFGYTLYVQANGKISIAFATVAGWKGHAGPFITQAQLTHLVVAVKIPFVHYYVNGTLTSIPEANPIIGNASHLARIGWDLTSDPGRAFPGYMDNIIFWNRALDQTEVTRHSLRRYPLK